MEEGTKVPNFSLGATCSLLPATSTARIVVTAEPLFIISRQYLVMEYSIVLSVTHVYQVCLVSDIAIFVLKRDVKLQPDVSCY